MTTGLVRHDAPIEVTIKDGRRVVQRDVVMAYLVDAHLTVFSATHGGVSGYISWRDNSGRPMERPKVSLRLADPAFELKDGTLCTCTEVCLPENRKD